MPAAVPEGRGQPGCAKDCTGTVDTTSSVARIAPLARHGDRTYPITTTPAGSPCTPSVTSVRRPHAGSARSQANARNAPWARGRRERGTAAIRSQRGPSSSRAQGGWGCATLTRAWPPALAAGARHFRPPAAPSRDVQSTMSLIQRDGRFVETESCSLARLLLDDSAVATVPLRTRSAYLEYR